MFKTGLFSLFSTSVSRLADLKMFARENYTNKASLTFAPEVTDCKWQYFVEAG